jgi:hypothetical protein
MSKIKILCVFLYVALIGAMLVMMVHGIGQFIDKMSLAVVIGLSVLFAASVNGEQSYIEKFGDGAERAGWLGFIIGVIVVFGSEYFGEGSLAEIGGSLVPAVTYIFYGYFFKMATMIIDPLKSL